MATEKTTSANGDVPKLADINKDTEKHKKKRKHDQEESEPKRAKDSQESKANRKKRATKPAQELKDTDINAGPPISDFRVSKETIENLNKRGITTLFPIQAATYDHVFDGKDLIGRARTGTGKTLSFVLPIVEKIKAEGPKWSSVSKGRHPRVIVMAPTRELAKQTAAEFEATAPFLDCICIYGGAPYEPQERALRRGVDVVVGTPGRIMDHMDRGNLVLDAIDWVVLDEADEMLNIGFADDMEKVLSTIPSTKAHQTLLFSATVPSWVKHTARKYMQQDYVTIDLVGSTNVQTASAIKHMAVCCPVQQRISMLDDLLTQYCGSGEGRAIVFADTKAEVTQISVSLKADTQALHGDILQAQREITLKGFKEGKFQVLVATDVAARGLDIPNVDLVVHMQPPKDVETYIHRSGRTARAGKQGTSITLYTSQRAGSLKYLETKAGIKIQRIGAPQLEDLITTSVNKGVKQLAQVHADVVPLFVQAAKDLIEEECLPRDDEEPNTSATPTPVEAATTLLAKALAYMAGYTGPIAKKSLLGMQENHTTLTVSGPSPIRSPRFVVLMLERKLGKNVAQTIRVSSNGTAVLDVPNEVVDTLLNLHTDYKFEVCKELPELEEEANSGRGGRGGGRPGRNGGGRNGGGRNGGGRDGGGGRRWSNDRRPHPNW